MFYLQRMFKSLTGRAARLVRSRTLQGWLQRKINGAPGTRDEKSSENLGSRIVWIFGAGRTGSTWLAHMMSDLDECRMWNEPYLGHMFGQLYYEVGNRRHDSMHFVLGGKKRNWLPHVRDFILGTAGSKFPDVATNPSLYLVIKDPHGSVGAPLVMEAVPESRMVLLVRDPRDAVASRLDARRPGGWSKKKELYERVGGDEDAVVRSMSKSFMREMTRAVEAYDAHAGPKTLVTYEELRESATDAMNRLCSELFLNVKREQIERIVESHAWENIPEEEKGHGKFQRKATPGGWREDLTPEQVAIVEGICKPFMDRFGYERHETKP